MSRVPTLAATIIAACLFGCQPRSSDVVQMEPTADDFATADRDRVWEAADTVLRDYRFPIYYKNRRDGRIESSPVVSQHFFEFWRRDVATRRDWIEATLNPIRRHAAVTLAATDDDGVRVEVAVYKERFSTPERQFNNSSAAFRFFGDLPSAETGRAIGPAESTWVAMGRDPAMENVILDAIRRGAGVD